MVIAVYHYLQGLYITHMGDVLNIFLPGEDPLGPHKISGTEHRITYRREGDTSVVDNFVAISVFR